MSEAAAFALLRECRRSRVAPLVVDTILEAPGASALSLVDSKIVEFLQHLRQAKTNAAPDFEERNPACLHPDIQSPFADCQFLGEFPFPKQTNARLVVGQRYIKGVHNGANKLHAANYCITGD